MYRVNVAVTAQAENELQRGLEEAGTLARGIPRRPSFEHFTREARLVADVPNLKAAVDTKDPPTVQPIAEEYQRQLESRPVPGHRSVRPGARRGRAARRHAGRQCVLATRRFARACAGQGNRVAVAARGRRHPGRDGPELRLARPELFGTLTVGFSLDERRAGTFKRADQQRDCVRRRRRVAGLDASARVQRATWRALVGGDGVRIDPSRRRAIRRASAARCRLQAAAAATADRAAAVATALILRSRTERLRFLNIVHRELAGTAFLAVLAATLLSYAVARTVTRPLGAITATMREMAATGDLTRKIALSPEPRWDDEDARLLAATFNSMTDSIARFQREAAQRERLSSLGRLSTVVAHEIRNPLMIIKTALRPLKREPVAAGQVRSRGRAISTKRSRG